MNFIFPASGAKTPATMLKMVVLPAPFGPIRALMPPSGTSKDASETALRPRKDLERFRTSSMQLQLFRNEGPNPIGQEHDHRQQHDAVEHLLDAGDFPAERGESFGDAVGKEREHGGAEDRAEEGADAADHRPEDQLDRAVDAEDLLGEKIVVVEGEKHAGKGGHRRADGDREHLPAEAVDAERLRGFLVLADGLPVIAGFRTQQFPAADEGHYRQKQNRVVVHERRAAEVAEVPGVALRHLEEHAAGSAGPVEVIEADARELGESDRQQGEIDARDAEAEGEEADHQAVYGAGEDGEHKPYEGGNSIMKKQSSGHISRHADVHRVAERELAGEAHHHVPGLAGVGEVKDQSCYGQRIGAGKCRKRGEKNSKNSQVDE